MRYTYSCEQGHDVVKKPTGEVTNKTQRSGLHGWKCSVCGPGVKVVRNMNRNK